MPNADVNLLKLPDDVTDEAGVFVGDVLTTGFYGAYLARARPDDVVAVLGCGPVGFCTIGALKSLGTRTVYALDREPSRLASPEAAGAIPVHIEERNPVTALAEATDGRGADVVIDAVGHPDAFESAIDTVRRGGTVVVLGVYSSETTEMQLGAYWSRALTLRFAGLTPVLAWWGLRGGDAGARRGGPHAVDQPSAAAGGCGRGLRAVRPPRGHEGDPGAVNVTVVSPEPSGLASMVADLIEQNLARDPARRALLRTDRGGARRARCRRHGVPPHPA